jgi:hypothetical protein
MATLTLSYTVVRVLDNYSFVYPRSPWGTLVEYCKCLIFVSEPLNYILLTLSLRGTNTKKLLDNNLLDS